MTRRLAAAFPLIDNGGDIALCDQLEAVSLASYRLCGGLGGKSGTTEKRGMSAN